MIGCKQLIAIAAVCATFCSLAAANPADRFATAQRLLHDGDAASALPILESLCIESPQNVDYMYAHGIALSRLGRDYEALDTLADAIDLAPHYEDVWRTRYNVLARLPDADALADFRTRAADQFPAASWWIALPEEPRYPWTLTLGTGFDALDNDLPNWNNQFVELRYEHDELQRYGMTLARDARSSTSDTSLGFAGEWSLSQWVVGVGLTHSSDAEIMPETGIELHAGRSFSNGWGTTLRYRQRDYENASVDSIIGNVEKYVDKFRVAYDLAWSRLDGDSSFASHVLTGSWYFSDVASVGVSLSSGREAEAIGGGQVLETDITAVTFSGRYQFSTRVGASWWLGVHEQGDLYRRQFLGIATSIRF